MQNSIQSDVFTGVSARPGRDWIPGPRRGVDVVTRDRRAIEVVDPSSFTQRQTRGFTKLSTRREA